MPVAENKKRYTGDVFEQTVLKALNRVKNGSITVIKQDNVIIQVNISEYLSWADDVEPRCKSNRLRLV